MIFVEVIIGSKMRLLWIRVALSPQTRVLIRSGEDTETQRSPVKKERLSYKPRSARERQDLPEAGKGRGNALPQSP